MAAVVEEPRQRALRIAESLVADVSGLISPPDICIRVTELVQSETSTIEQIGEVIIRDPNLTGRLLRLVNSPYFGLRGKVDTVSRAITVIGLRELHHIVLAISAVKSFSNIPNQLVNMDTFWRHSIYTGLLARSLARRSNVLHPERLFIAGLLHDIGSLVLYCRLHEMARDLLMTADGDEEVLHRAELDALGFTHADLGALLLARWQLPETLRASVAHHHAPATAAPARVEATLLYAANILANRSGLGGYCETPKPVTDVDAALIAGAGLDVQALTDESIIGEAGLQFAETVAVLAA